MIKITYLAAYLLGVFTVFASQLFSVWGLYRFEQFLKSRKGRNRYIIKKRKKK